MDSSLLTTLDGRRRFVDTFDALLSRWQTVAGTLAVDGGALKASALGDWGNNLITNGEFTANTTKWGGVGSSLSRVDSAVDPGMPSGGMDSYVLKIVSTVNAPSSAYTYSSVPSWTELVGATYKASCRVYIPSSNAATGFTWGIQPYTGATVAVADSWQPATHSVVAVAGTNYVRGDIGPAGLAIGDVAYIDSVTTYRQNAAAIRNAAPAFRARLAHVSPAAPSVVPAGWMFRYTGPLDYWELRLLPNTAGNDLQIVQVTAGVDTVRAEADVDWTDGGTDEVELIVRGSTITTRYRKAGGVWTAGPSYASATQGAQARAMGPLVYGTTTARWARVGVDW